MAPRLIKALFTGVVTGTLLTAPQSSAVAESSQPKNIIMVVADGMGPAYTSAYRYYNDTDLSDGVTPTIFDKLLMGSASTYPAPESGIVTDSAAGATALATGTKSYNGAIAVDVQRKPLNTVLREAKRNGMRTGLAVTSQIVHATPASYVTHNESRRNYNEIANQFFDDRVDGNFIVDVMLGGGTSYFEREDRDLIAEFIDAGYQYTDSYNKLATYNSGKKLLGLFGDVGLPWALDDKRKHRLSYLAKHAIKHLENDAGYFLLIEASQIDWAGHVNDVASAMAEMDDLAHTMIYLEEYVTKNPDTLVVLTADHSTGGFAIGANGNYKWDPSWLKNVKSSPDMIVNAVLAEADPVAYVAKQFGFDLNDNEKESVLTLVQESDVRKRASALKMLLDERTNTGWTTSGHTGVDVPVFAMGPKSYVFAGGQDNTDIAKKIFSLLEARKNGNFSKSSTKPKPKTKKRKSEEDKETSDDDDDICNFKEDWHC
jgi:alkaline phosphatase